MTLEGSRNQKKPPFFVSALDADPHVIFPFFFPLRSLQGLRNFGDGRDVHVIQNLESRIQDPGSKKKTYLCVSQ